MQTQTTQTNQPALTTIKKTEIYVRGYDCDFVITLEKDFYLSFEQAEAYIKREIIDTAIVKKVVQKWDNGDLTLEKTKK